MICLCIIKNNTCMARLLKCISLSFLYTSVYSQESAQAFYFEDEIPGEIVKQSYESMFFIGLPKMLSLNNQNVYCLINCIDRCRTAFVGLIKRGCVVLPYDDFPSIIGKWLLLI